MHMVLTSDRFRPPPWNYKMLKDSPDRFREFESTYPRLVRERLRKFSSPNYILPLGIVVCCIKEAETRRRRASEDEYGARGGPSPRAVPIMSGFEALTVSSTLSQICRSTEIQWGWSGAY